MNRYDIYYYCCCIVTTNTSYTVCVHIQVYMYINTNSLEEGEWITSKRDVPGPVS